MQHTLFYKIQFRIDHALFATDDSSEIYKPDQTINHKLFAEIIEEKLATITYFEESSEDWCIRPIDSERVTAATFVELYLPLHNIFSVDAVTEQCVEYLQFANIVKYYYIFEEERHIAYDISLVQSETK